MIDIHSHILPNVDDGSKSIDDSIEMIKSAKENGFDTICCTPHYLKHNYCSSKENNLAILEKLKRKLKKENIDIKLLLGNETYINENILEEIDQKKMSCLGNTKYILLEMPKTQDIKYLDNIFYEIKNKGYKILIAHPERNTYIQKNPESILEYLNDGIYFQGNFMSICGFYGKKAKKTLKKLLKINAIQILASDEHFENNSYSNIKKIIKKLRWITKKSKIEILLNENPKRLLENNELIK